MGIPLAQLTISLGGYVRTIVTPLDRHKGTREITWGLGRIRTIATPLDRRNATVMTIWGLWSYPNPSLNHLDHTHTSSYIASS